MGKRDVRVIVVRKRVTALLLALVSVAMLALVWYLSGKTYASESRGAVQEAETLLRFHAESDSRLIAASMPLLADVLAFIPWGFLAFMLVTRDGTTRSRAYLMAGGGALLFALAMETWQFLLPTRVTSYGDALFQFAGALIGTVFAHARLSVRFRFVV